MLQYLVILLDDTSVSYCHCDNTCNARHLISLADLKAGILFGMKENLMIQFVYPEYELPRDYLEVIDTIDHHDIKPCGTSTADVVVFDSLNQMKECQLNTDTSYVLRITKSDLLANGETVLMDALNKVQRLNIVFRDLDAFTDVDIEKYNAWLTRMSVFVKDICDKGKMPQLNILTDRMMLDKPNHCNAGVENITLAPNGKFYVCPAFYYSNNTDYVGDITSGIDIKNPQLLRLDHAPLCRHCDAYHCRRCVWMNRKTTLEVNTPGIEQCVVAHTERNASRKLLADIREKNVFMPEIEIPEINYLDPFEVRKEL